MRKILALLFLAFVLSACTTYRFQKSGPAGKQGYVVTYDGKPIVEYTVGKDNSLPGLTLAKKRFKRRRSKVEYYYKNMGQMTSRMKEYLLDPPVMFLDFVGGVVRWPFIAYYDRKYNRDPKYRERVDKRDEERDVLERARTDSFKEKLDAYIATDLAKESPSSKEALASTPKAAAQAPAPAAVKDKAAAPVALSAPAAQPVVAQPQAAIPKPLPVPAKPVSIKKKPVAVPAEPPVAVIIAKPSKGFSPLKVRFYGQKSHSKSGRIVSYDWDFGDGDTSTKKNPENTFWSTTYGVRNFTVTLTVRDEAGNTSSASTVIEVSTH